jgi:hypothetical protein
MARRYRSYTDEELLATLALVNDGLNMAGYRLIAARPSRQSYWRNRIRALGHKKRSICIELSQRGLLYDPTGRYGKQEGTSALVTR